MVLDIKKQINDEPFWFFTKFSFSLVWLHELSGMIFGYNGCPYPTGICTLYNFNFLFTSPGIFFTVALLAVVAFLYLLEKQMLLTTALGCLLTIVIISHHESNGIYKRATALSLVWLGHLLAYLLAEFNPSYNSKKNRMHLPIQFIAALYVLAAASKLYASGISWAAEGAANLPLTIIKSARFEYYSKGDESVMRTAQQLAATVVKHQSLLKIFLWISLMLELFCFVVVFDKTLRIYYGFALLIMHIGIYLVMDIVIVGQIYPMLIFFVNPLYHVYRSKQTN
jgi:hypothetical protein